MIRVLRPGTFTTVQDAGRRARHLGFPVCGALDGVALRLSNALVGNPAGAAALEVTLSGPTLHFPEGGVVALCGAPFEATLGGAPLPHWRAVPVPAGGTLHLGGAPAGGRTLLAVRGALPLGAVLGSLSTDVRGGYGGFEGRPLARGDVLPWATAPAGPPPRAAIDPALRSGPARHVRLRVRPTSEATPEVLRALLGRTFTVSAQADRMGARLREAVAAPTQAGRASEANLLGGVQLPPDGQPIVLLNDAGTHGGYPQPLGVIRADRHRLAHLRPGDRVTFVPVTPEVATAALRALEHDLRTAEAALRWHWANPAARPGTLSHAEH
ncbi:biotin-dependent carboxyltransferase family protein [Deinococcus maricopensis]|uniref:Urea carboxylase n=1 Tax=Deinococcus maricopensis (strain DSM 21211 / LMG 22137 / NRRL B-23946 / LB-34) TaxID=709986 RepID=E8U5L3_DEIML|nr:biotin-dependent carboxyltransferase family protein [Deinococcus maricopensis]ADV66352.1 Urea carboxylase [Deinococcus maricopensis DSM 21211]